MKCLLRAAYAAPDGAAYAETPAPGPWGPAAHRGVWIIHISGRSSGRKPSFP